MKRFFQALIVLVLLLLIAVLVLPLFFKKEIRSTLDEQIAKRVHATVNYGDIGLNMVGNFPHFTLTLKDLNILGKDEFAGDTLLNAPEVGVVLNFTSILAGDQPTVRKMRFRDPKLNLQVKRNGRANFEIFDQQKVRTGNGAWVKMALRKYDIQNGQIRYDNRKADVQVEMRGFNHSGKGPVNDPIFTFETQTSCEDLSLTVNNIHWMRNIRLESTADFTISADRGVILVEENQVRLNDLILQFGGSAEMGENSAELDLNFSNVRPNFADLLSVAPGMYGPDFKTLYTDGTFQAEGTLSGKIDANTAPGWGLNLQVSNGYFRYPELPESAQNLQLDAQISIPQSPGKPHKIEIKNLTAVLAKQKIELKGWMEGRKSKQVKLKAKTQFDFSKMAQVFPMEKMDLGGELFVDIEADGKYAPQFGKSPGGTGTLSLTNFRYQPKNQAEALQAEAKINWFCPDDSAKHSEIRIDTLYSQLGNDVFQGNFSLRNPQFPSFSLFADGKMQLEKWGEVFPFLKGNWSGGLNFDKIHIKGTQMASGTTVPPLLETQGSITPDRLTFEKAGFPGFQAKVGKIKWNGENLEADSLRIQAGNSELLASGKIARPIAWLLEDSIPLESNWELISPGIDFNSWLTEPGDPPRILEKGKYLNLMRMPDLPQDWNATVQVRAGKAAWDNLETENFQTNCTLHSDTIFFKNLNFDAFGGSVSGFGKFVPGKNSFMDWQLDLKQVQIQACLANFPSLKQVVPPVQGTEGKMDASILLQSPVDEGLWAEPANWKMSGTATLFEVQQLKAPISFLLAQSTQLSDLNEIRIQEIPFSFTLRQGRFTVESFSTTAGDLSLEISGEHTLSGQLNYKVKLEIPRGKLNARSGNALSRLTGESYDLEEAAELEITIGGNYQKPGIYGPGGQKISAPANQAMQPEIEEEALNPVQQEQIAPVNQQNPPQPAASQPINQPANQPVNNPKPKQPENNPPQNSSPEAENPPANPSPDLEELKRQGQEAVEKAKAEAERKRKEAENQNDPPPTSENEGASENAEPAETAPEKEKRGLFNRRKKNKDEN